MTDPVQPTPDPTEERRKAAEQERDLIVKYLEQWSKKMLQAAEESKYFNDITQALAQSATATTLGVAAGRIKSGLHRKSAADAYEKGEEP